MFDVFALIAFLAMFGVGFAYVRGCDALRGRHS